MVLVSVHHLVVFSLSFPLYVYAVIRVKNDGKHLDWSKPDKVKIRMTTTIMKMCRTQTKIVR